MRRGLQLYTFGISHYCERARWGLDWRGLAYEEIRWPPGPHVVLARRLGAPLTCVPILLAEGEVIQGSDQILDWTQRRPSGSGRTLEDGEDLELARELERRAEVVLGVHVRRLFYAETLTEHPEAVKPALFAGVSPPLRLVGEAMWPITRRKMIELMDARPLSAADSQARIEQELTWLDELLARGKGFLAGTRFSRADLTVATLLAPLAKPVEVPVYRDMALPARLSTTLDNWRGRPVLEWVRRIYGEYRNPPGKAREPKPSEPSQPPPPYSG